MVKVRSKFTFDIRTSEDENFLACRRGIIFSVYLFLCKLDPERLIINFIECTPVCIEFPQS